MEQQAALPGILEGIDRDMRAGFADVTFSALAPFRGGGWQCYAQPAHRALRAGLFIRAALGLHFGAPRRSGADTRVSIALSGYDFLDPENPGACRGAAFTLSGRALDAMEKEPKKRLVLTLETRGEDDGPARYFDLLGRFCDFLVRSWTASQARAVLRIWSLPYKAELEEALERDWEQDPDEEARDQTRRSRRKELFSMARYGYFIGLLERTSSSSLS